MVSARAACNAPAGRHRLGRTIGALAVFPVLFTAIAVGVDLAAWWLTGASGAYPAGPGPAVARRGPDAGSVPLRVAVARTAMPVRPTVVASTAALRRVFRRDGFSLDAVGSGAPVPRRYVAAVPADIKRAVKTVALRKALFLKLALPVILRVNERIAAERAYLLELERRKRSGDRLSIAERAWLVGLARAYRLERVDFPALRRRVDVIPPSLALAQAIVESGWGTSVAARRGNALFGQMAYGGGGIAGTAIRQGGIVARIAGFASLYRSAAAYARNLNTHAAYRAFRQTRASLRRAGSGNPGPALARTLLKYSELGGTYVRYLLVAMRNEDLARFDRARLEPHTLFGGF